MKAETGYLYVIEDLRDGRVYVGSTTHPEQRRSQHFSTRDLPIGKAIQDEGPENFEFILLEQYPKDKLLEREAYWIGALNACQPYGYNVQSSGLSPNPAQTNVDPFYGTLMGRPNTIKTHKSLYKNWIQERVENVSDEALDDWFLIGLIKYWTQEGLKPGTMKSLITLYARYVRWRTGRAVETRQLSSTIGKMQEQGIPKAWSKEEAKKALACARQVDPILYKMMVLTLHSGLRKGEMFGLKWKDLDFLRGRINVCRSYDGPTKNGKPRSIPMSPVVEKLFSGDYTVGSDESPVFQRTCPNSRLGRVATICDVPTLSWHGLRHTFATLGLEAGVSPKLVSHALGHSKLSTTLDIYWNFTRDDLDLGFVP